MKRKGKTLAKNLKINKNCVLLHKLILLLDIINIGSFEDYKNSFMVKAKLSLCLSN
jgi:hypothetical protein